MRDLTSSILCASRHRSAHSSVRIFTRASFSHNFSCTRGVTTLSCNTDTISHLNWFIADPVTLSYNKNTFSDPNWFIADPAILSCKNHKIKTTCPGAQLSPRFVVENVNLGRGLGNVLTPSMGTDFDEDNKHW